MLFNFKVWIESQEDYERKFSSRAKSAFYSRENHFEKWFPENLRRTYLPLNKQANRSLSQYTNSQDYFSPEDHEVIEGLKGLGYEILDYREGYVKRGHGKEKIGGVLNKLIALNPNKKELYNKWLRQFNTSPSRVGKSLVNNLWVIISYNPHDIATMSYDRNWESCMELEDGLYKKTPFCVVRSGGMVAYLVNKSEAEVRKLVTSEWEPIDKPIARLAIKAAKSVKDSSVVIALPEETIYGVNVKGFWETVRDWIEKNQGDVGSGRYKVLGGYSDTWGKEGVKIHNRSPKDEKELINWIKSNVGNRSESAVKYVLDHHDKFTSPEIWQEIKEVLIDKATHSLHYADPRLLYLIDIKPDVFTQEEMDKLPFAVKEKLNKLSKEDRQINDIINSGRGEAKSDDNYVLRVTKVLSSDNYHKIIELIQNLGDKKFDLGDQQTLSKLIFFLDSHLSTIINLKEIGKYSKIIEQSPSMLKDLAKQFFSLSKVLLNTLLKNDRIGKIKRENAEFDIINFINFITHRKSYLKDLLKDQYLLKDYNELEDKCIEYFIKFVENRNSSFDEKLYWANMISKFTGSALKPENEIKLNKLKVKLIY